MSEPESRRASGVRAAYESFLRRRDAGEAIDFDAYCDAHPEIANALRVMRSLDGGADDAAGGDSFERLIRAELGVDLTAHTVAAAAAEDAGEDEVVPIASGRRRYQVRREIARGGMGVILEVWDVDLERALAMKVMRVARAGESSKRPSSVPRHLFARFLNEARITGRLDHPGVVPVHEIGVDASGRVFFTMPLVEGRELGEIFRLAREEREGWSRTRALGVLVRVCDAIAYAHERGVIHRDLKPANVMVGRFGEAYVMDWGLAKSAGPDEVHDLRPGHASIGAVELDDTGVEDSPLLTADGTVLGTPAYMSPEQAAGRVDELDEASDIYAVGAMLYTLLTGRQPYVEPTERRSSRQIVDAVVAGAPKAIHEIERGASPELVSICEKAMARGKADRYATMERLADDLRAYLENRVVQAHRTGAVAEFGKWVARNRGMAASIAAASVLIVAGLVAFIIWQALARSELEVERLRTSDALGRVTGLLGEREAALERSEGLRLVARASAIVAENPGEALLVAIEGARRAPGVLANDALLGALGGLRELRTLLMHTGVVVTARFDPQGRRLATASSDATACLWDPGSGEPTARIVDERYIMRAAEFSPDGRRLAVSNAHGDCRILDAATGEILLVLRQSGVLYRSVFSPDGSSLLIACRDGQARLWDASSGELLASFEHPDVVRFVAFSPDGESLATACDDRVARLWSRGGRLLHTLSGHEGGVTHVDWSPDGSRVVTSSTDSTARVWSVATGEQATPPLEHRGWIRTAVFGPDGQRIVTASADGTAALWNADGRRVGTLVGHEDELNTAFFDGDGSRVVTSSEDQTARIWDVATARELVVLRGHRGAVREATFSPGGERIVTASDDRTARVWDARSERETTLARRRSEWRGSTSYSPDLTRVVVYAFGSRAEIRDARTGELVVPLEGHSDLVLAARFSRDGSRVVTAGRDAKAIVWSSVTGAKERVLPHEDRVLDAAFSSDGANVVTSSLDFTARVWDLATGTSVLLTGQHRSGSGVLGVSMSPTGRLVVTYTNDGTARLWDARSGHCRATLAHAGATWVQSAAFSAADRWLVTASDDDRVRLWNVASAQHVATLEGYTGKFVGAAFCDGAPLLATLHADGTARVWRIPGGEPVATVRTHRDRFVRAEFTADGSALRTTSSAGFDDEWPLEPLRVALERTPHPMTWAEMQRVGLGDEKALREAKDREALELARRRCALAVRVVEANPASGLGWAQGALALRHEASVFAESDEAEGYLSALERAAEVTSRNAPELLILLADQLAANDRWREATLALEAALELPGFDPRIAMGLRRCRQRLGADLPSYASIDAALTQGDRHVLCAVGAEWRFLRGLAEPPSSWPDADFDDSLWEIGKSAFGFGNAGYGTAHATSLLDMRLAYTSIYLRHRFTVTAEQLERWRRLGLWIVIDDGCIAYLNGTEIARVRVDVRAERLEFDSTASSSPPSEPVEPITFAAPIELLREGDNVLAIHALSRGLTGADFYVLPVLFALREGTGDHGLTESLRRHATGADASRRLRYLEGRVLSRRGEHAEAASVFAELLGPEPSSARLRCWLVASLRAAGDTAGADSEALRLLERSAPVVNADHALLRAAAGQSVFDPTAELLAWFHAWRWARRALELDPDDSTSRSTAAAAEYRLGLPARALETLKPQGLVALFRAAEPDQLAVTAAARLALGERDAAGAALAAARARLALDRWANSWDVLRLIREVERALDLDGAIDSPGRD